MSPSRFAPAQKKPVFAPSIIRISRTLSCQYYETSQQEDLSPSLFAPAQKPFSAPFLSQISRTLSSRCHKVYDVNIATDHRRMTRQVYCLQHIATHCNTLRHTATHCNTLMCHDLHNRMASRHRSLHTCFGAPLHVLCHLDINNSIYTCID